MYTYYMYTYYMYSIILCEWSVWDVNEWEQSMCSCGLSNSFNVVLGFDLYVPFSSVGVCMYMSVLGVGGGGLACPGLCGNEVANESH